MSVDQSIISQVMREMGRRGGKVGGKKRMESMGAEGRSEFGRAAVKARWAKERARKAAQETRVQDTSPQKDEQ